MTPPTRFPFRVASPSGLSAEWNANGSLRRMDGGDILLNLYLGNEVEGGLTNLYLRRLGPTAETLPLLGPTSPAVYRFDERGLSASGSWGDLAFCVRFTLAEAAPVWFWHAEIANMGNRTETCDLLYAQDLALAHYGAVRLNEFYVCHYVDHTPLRHPRVGTAVASRQNLSMAGHTPWTLIGSLTHGTSYSTDALQFYGRSRRSDDHPPALASGLSGTRLQQEHALVAIQDTSFVLAPGARAVRGFFGLFQPDKPTATSADDAAAIDRVLALPEAAHAFAPTLGDGARPAASLFATAPQLETLDLCETELDACFGTARRHEERNAQGDLLSFFVDDATHVALRRKEVRVLRPHGLLLRTGGALTPDEAALTSTAWMNGVFHSMVTQGHVSINRFLSTSHSYLGLFRSHGQRVFVETDDGWRLLGLPSAFAMRPDAGRWLYKHAGGLLEVTASAPDDAHELRLTLSVLSGRPARFLVSHHIALNGDDGSTDAAVLSEQTGDAVFVRAIPDSDVGRRFPNGGFEIAPATDTRFERIGGDELLFADGVSHHQPFLCFRTAPAASAGLTIRGRLIDSVPSAEETLRWTSLADAARIDVSAVGHSSAAAARTADLFPWLVQNALVHYLSPRGLEQYSGGGWGTRDVCQGPVELLLALGRFAPIRDLLLRVFRQQNPDGDWPQWFMFFDRERNIRPGDSHGDIVFWPLLALAQYLAATGDAALLDEPLPFFHPNGDDAAERGRLLDHVDRALTLISRRVIAGTVLAAYGHGDWNDALQPARPDMRERLCSSWTVTLHYQTLTALAAAFHRLGDTARADALNATADRVLADFQRILIKDGVLAGLVYFRENGPTDYLLHPRDGLTGLSYSLLAMISAISNDLFTPAQAKAHLALIRDHLTGPDGAHLFDRPMPYRGGVQTYFQRIETATYFGREIGLMYTHAHLRTCEALAHFGDAEGFFRGLRQINPIALQELVPSAAPRQANCYYSSSDPAFADRYDAFEHYARALRGEVALEGGWRVYSSGAGIAARLIVQNFLGLRQEADALVIDPVIPKDQDGLTARVTLYGHPVDVTYHIQTHGCGPISAALNGSPLPFTRDANPYRPGALRVPVSMFGLSAVNRLSIQIA